MDEIPVWADMVTDTTVESVGKKDIPMKAAGHKKGQGHVSNQGDRVKLAVRTLISK